MTWLITVRPGKRRLLDPAKPTDALTEQHKRMKAGIRMRIEHPFRVLKRQFRFVKVRHRGVLKSTAQLQTMFALVNLWIGATQTAGSLGMSAPVVRQMAKLAPNTVLQARELRKTSVGRIAYQWFSASDRSCLCCADLPEANSLGECCKMFIQSIDRRFQKGI